MPKTILCITGNNNNTDADGDTSMILTKISKRDNISTEDIRKLFRPNPSSSHYMKEITIDGKLYSQVKTSFIYVSNQNCTHCQSLVERGENGGLMVRILLSSIRPHACMSKFEASTTMRLLQFLFIPLVLWIIYRMSHLS